MSSTDTALPTPVDLPKYSGFEYSIELLIFIRVCITSQFEAEINIVDIFFPINLADNNSTRTW